MQGRNEVLFEARERIAQCEGHLMVLDFHDLGETWERAVGKPQKQAEVLRIVARQLGHGFPLPARVSQGGCVEAVSEPESEGTRLGRMMASEPELTAPALDDAGREFIRRFVAYLTAGGSDCGSMVTRLERLKFETIVGEKTYGEVLAEMEGP